MDVGCRPGPGVLEVTHTQRGVFAFDFPLKICALPVLQEQVDKGFDTPPVGISQRCSAIRPKFSGTPRTAAPCRRELSAGTRLTINRVPVASARRRSVANDGDTRPLSSRAIADWVVPSRRASCACVRFAAVRARISASMSAYSSSLRSYSSRNSGLYLLRYVCHVTRAGIRA